MKQRDAARSQRVGLHELRPLAGRSHVVAMTYILRIMCSRACGSGAPQGRSPQRLANRHDFLNGSPLISRRTVAGRAETFSKCVYSSGYLSGGAPE